MDKVLDSLENDSFNKFVEIYTKTSFNINEKYKILDKALNKGFVEVVDHLYKTGLDINHKNSIGYTALHEVIRNDSLKIIDYLCSNGINMEERNNDGKTALDLAFEYGYYVVFKFLFLKQLANNDCSLKFFVDKLESNGSSNGSLVTFVNNILEWVGARPRVYALSESKTNNQIVCTQDPYSHHLVMCTLKLKCGHMSCFKCALKTIFNKYMCICTICKSRNGIWIYRDLKETDTIWNTYKCSTLEIGSICINTVNKSLSDLEDTRQSTNEGSIRELMSLIQYSEDSVESKIKSIKSELNILEERLKKSVENCRKGFKSLKNPNYCEKSLRKFKQILKFMNNFNGIQCRHIGKIKFQPLFMQKENHDSLYRSAEKIIYNNFIRANNVDSVNYVKNKVGKIINGLMNKSDFFLFDFERETGEITVLKTIEALLIDSSSTKEKAFNMVMVPNSSSLTSNNDVYLLECLFQNEIKDLLENIKIFESSTDVQLIKILKDIFKSNTLELFLEEIDEFRLKKMNEYEILAFKLIRYGTIEEFVSLFDQNKSIRVNAVYEPVGHTMLFEAIEYERFEFVEFLLQKDVDLSFSYDGKNALQKAALENNMDDIIDLLIKKGCPFGDRPLEIVLLDMVDQINSVKTLQLRKKNRSESTILNYISSRGKANFLEFLEKEELVSLISTNNNCNVTYVDRAAATGHYEFISQLFDKVAGDSGTKKRKIEICICLKHVLKFCNKTNIFDQKQFKFNKMRESENMLFNIGGLQTDVIINKIEYLLQKKYYLLEKNEYGNNLLMHLVTEKHCLRIDDKLLKYFIGKQFDLENSNNQGQNISHLAAISGDLNLLKLISDKISLNEKDSNGYTPVMYAVKHGYIHIVKWLLQDFDTTKSIINGNTQLIDMALFYGHENIYKIIKKCGGVSRMVPLIHSTNIFKHKNLNKILPFLNLSQVIKYSLNHDRLDSFIIGSFKNCKVDTLLDGGIDLRKYKDNFGANALHLAASLGRNDIILWLYVKNFQFDSVDHSGFTALAYAALNGHISTTVLLKLLGLDDLFLSLKPFLSYYLSCQGFISKLENDLCTSITFLLINCITKSSEFISKNNGNIHLKTVLDDFKLKLGY